MAYEITFNRKACERCGGTGTYHVANFGPYGGSEARSCYGCSGRGWNLLPTGRKARVAFLAERERLAAIAIDEIRIGDKVLIDGKWRLVSTTGENSVTYGGGQCHHSFQPGTRLITAARLHAAWADLVAFARGLKGATVKEVA